MAGPQGPQVGYLPDGRRLYLHHGPIDLVIDAEGPGRKAALRSAADRFATILDELVGELALLRAPLAGPGAGKRFRNRLAPEGRVARAMVAAARPHAGDYVTPMVAVAGAVADEILAAMVAPGGVLRAYVNNGGDVALHLTPGQSFTAALADGAGGRALIGHPSPVRGVASSGWRGRSHSRGIADMVTALAPTAAAADAAATMIANAVDLPGSAKVARAPAWDLAPDSDLGDLPVTVGVAPLLPAEAAAALDRGRRFAQTCLDRGLVVAALLVLDGQRRIVGPVALPEAENEDIAHA